MRPAEERMGINICAGMAEKIGMPFTGVLILTEEVVGRRGVLGRPCRFLKPIDFLLKTSRLLEIPSRGALSRPKPVLFS